MQDARFQQLFEQYQDTVLRAARELDDAAIGFAQLATQVAILEESVQAARRSLDIADVQYREGLVDFQRVLDSQRALFSQQERLVADEGRRRAEPDRPLQGDGRRLAGGPLAADRRRRDARHDGASAATGSGCSTLRSRRLSRVPAVPRDGLAMSQDRRPPDESAPNASLRPPSPAAGSCSRATRKGAASSVSLC